MRALWRVRSGATIPLAGNALLQSVTDAPGCGAGRAISCHDSGMRPLLRLVIAAALAAGPSRPAAAVWRPPEIREPLRFADDERRATTVGFGAGGLVQRQGPTSAAPGRGDRGGLLALRLRLLAFLETPARSGRFLWLVQPELHVAGVLGGLRLAGGLVTPFAGVFGQAGASAGLASPGLLGVYLKGSLVAAYRLTGRMLPDGHSTLADSYLLAPLGLEGGLRIGPRSDVTLLLGPRLAAVFGVEALAGAHGVAQLAAGAEFTAQAIVGYHAYLALSGGLDRSVAGQAFGGRRMQARGSVDFIFPSRWDLRLSVSLMYRGMGVHVDPRPGGAAGVSLVSHVMLVGLGLGG